MAHAMASAIASEPKQEKEYPEDSDIEAARIAGEITLALESGTHEEREGLLAVIAQICGSHRADEFRDEYCKRPGGLPRCEKCGWCHEEDDICQNGCNNEGEEWKQ